MLLFFQVLSRSQSTLGPYIRHTLMIVLSGKTGNKRAETRSPFIIIRNLGGKSTWLPSCYIFQAFHPFPFKPNTRHACMKGLSTTIIIIITIRLLCVYVYFFLNDEARAKRPLRRETKDSCLFILAAWLADMLLSLFSSSLALLRN